MIFPKLALVGILSAVSVAGFDGAFEGSRRAQQSTSNEKKHLYHVNSYRPPRVWKEKKAKSSLLRAQHNSTKTNELVEGSIATGRRELTDVRPECLIFEPPNFINICEEEEASNTTDAPVQYSSPVAAPVVTPTIISPAAAPVVDIVEPTLVSETPPVVESKVVGGEPAEATRYPWYVSLVTGDSRNFHSCGGMLISPNLVLTAAHCLAVGPEYALVGRYNQTNDDYQRIEIEMFYPNPSFNVEERTFDQAIIKLASPVTDVTPLSVNLDPTIPSPETTDMKIVGLGRLEYQGARPDLLQVADMAFISNEDCAKDYRDLPGEEITDDMICIDDRDSSQCSGDSGGPYLIPGDGPDTDLVVGIVSWGVDCGDRKYPNVGSRTSAGEFIREAICALEDSPLDEWDCPQGFNNLPGDSATAVLVKISIYHDLCSEEISWELTNSDGTVLVYVPTGSYDQVDLSEEILMLEPGETYTFVIKDKIAADGIIGVSFPMFEVVLLENDSIRVNLGQGLGDFDEESQLQFTVPFPDDYPDPPAPEPTQVPVEDPMDVSINIKFDKWHEEIHWKITTENDDEIFGRPAGYYRSGDSVTEHVLLGANQTYNFYIFDYFGDGIARDDGIVYSVYLEDPIILLAFGDGLFVDERSHTFTLPAAEVEEPTDPPAPACESLFNSCSNPFDCCSNRCVMGVCRSLPRAAAKGRLSGTRSVGGAATRVRGQ